MKSIIQKLGISLLVLVIAFVFYTLQSTGYLRTIDQHFNGTILQKIALIGAEDIMISRQDSFALISSTNRAPNAKEEGGLFLIDLRFQPYRPIPLTKNFHKEFAPHGISFFKIGDYYKVMAISHTDNGHSIEVFKLQNQTLEHVETMEDPSMIQPNDLVMIDQHRFYFTNDHGYTKGFMKFFEEYSGMGFSNVVYYDGVNYQEVDNGIAYANGINYDKTRDLLFVASPRHFRVKVYKVLASGSLESIENIPCKTGVDNIEFDEDGKLWIGSHPNLLKFASYAKGKSEKSPSEIITIEYQKKGEYSIEKVYIEDGSAMAASTVAVPFGNHIFVGNVMDDEFLILQRN